VKLIRRVYRERRDAMLEALQAEFPSEVTWTRPQGGLFLWVTLPEGLDAQQLFAAAIQEHVAFVPGESFYAPNGTTEEGRRHLRLNFSASDPEKIHEGIRRLGVAIRWQLDAMRPLGPSTRYSS